MILQLALLHFDIRGKVPIPDITQGSHVQVSGILYLREQKEEHQILYLKDVSLSMANQKLECANIILYDKQHIPVSLGNSILATGELYFFQSARNSGNFDQEKYQQRKNISAFVTSVDCEVNQTNIWRIRDALQGFRETWKSLFEDALGERDGKTMSAILLGTREDIDLEIKELYQQSGIVHILSISGLHISFIGIALQKILQKMRCPTLLSAILATVFLGTYVMFVGASISAVRAFVMYLLSIGALLVRRVDDGKTSLAFTATLISLWNPHALLDAGFILSFGALAGLILVLPILREVLPKIPKMLLGLYAGVAVHLLLLPVLLFYYYEWFPYSFLINLLVVPLIGVVMGIGLLGSVICLVFPPLGLLVLKGCQIILVICEHICRYFVKWPGSSFVAGKPEIWEMVIYYLILFSTCFLVQKFIQKKWKKRMVLIVGILLAHVCVCVHYPNRQMLEVVMLDVGQGDGIFIRSPKGTTYFIDGGSSDIKNVGRYRIEPFLKSKGIAVLDYVLISHGHADHLNGIAEMLERQEYGVKIRNIILPHSVVHDDVLRELSEQAQGQNINVYTMTAGEHLQEGDFSLTCLQPSAEYTGEIGNPSSMILSLQYKEFDMLFTGDVEGIGEQMLVEILPIKEYEVLKVAHHGSKNSTELAFLEKVQPSYALISAGVHNSYGHPHAETLERLEMFESVIYKTNTSGAITIRTNGETMQVEEYLVF